MCPCLIESYFICIQGQCENHSSAINGHDKHEEEIANLKARFLQHKKILTSNYEQSENEVNRLDEMYHDTIDMVLKVNY